MLLCKDRRRHEIRHLLSILHRLKRRPDRNLGLSVSDVAADEAVHDLRTLHILFYCLDRRKLVFRLFKRKHLFEFALPYGIITVHKALLALALRVQLYEVLRDHTDSALYARFRAAPFLCPELVQLRRLRVAVGIFLDHIKLRRRYVQIAAAGVIDLHVILCDMVDFNLFNSPVYAQPVVFVDNEVTDGKLSKAADPLSFITAVLFLFLLHLAENITF